MQFSVGAKCPALAGRGEGVIFEADSSGYLMIYNLVRPREEEIEQMRSGEAFEIAFAAKNGAIWVLSKCGDMPWSDSPFHPALAPHWSDLVLPGDGEGHALTLISADAASTEIKSLRLIGLGHDFSVRLHEACAELAAAPFDSGSYDRGIAETMAAYTTRQLLGMAAAKWGIR